MLAAMKSTSFRLAQTQVNVARQTVELGYEQGGPDLSAWLKCQAQLELLMHPNGPSEQIGVLDFSSHLQHKVRRVIQ